MNIKASFYTVLKTIGILLQISVAMLFLHTQAFADSPAPPYDFKKVTENKKYVFVMLEPDEVMLKPDEVMLEPDEWAEQDPKIRKIYKQSGLYKNDGSSTPLWTVDWYAFEVFPCSDGEHLIQMGPWASSTDQLAISFHENGKIINEYQIKDLIKDESKIMHTVSHFFWMSELKYDDKHTVLFLKTEDNQAYTFSAITGEILPIAQ